MPSSHCDATVIGKLESGGRSGAREIHSSGSAGRSMSRGTHLSGVGFLDGRLPLLHDCFLRRRRGSIGVRSVAMGSPDEARGGFGVPEAGRIARRGGEQFQRPGRGGAGSAVEGNRAPSETSWSRMFTSDRPMSPDTSVRRECGALRRMEQCRSLFDISQENAREKKSSQPVSQSATSTRPPLHLRTRQCNRRKARSSRPTRPSTSRTPPIARP